jgi:hypothetical protein
MRPDPARISLAYDLQGIVQCQTAHPPQNPKIFSLTLFFLFFIFLAFASSRLKISKTAEATSITLTQDFGWPCADFSQLPTKHSLSWSQLPKSSQSFEMITEMHYLRNTCKIL